MYLFDGVEYSIVELTKRDIVDLLHSSEETQLKLLSLEEEMSMNPWNDISDREIYREFTGGQIPDDDDEIDFGDIKDQMGY